MQSTMSEDGGELVVPKLCVEDDLSQQSYVVNLKDWVRTVDRNDGLANQHSLIINLLNNEILERYPHVAAANRKQLNITIEEFSDIKAQVLEKLVSQEKQATKPAE